MRHDDSRRHDDSSAGAGDTLPRREPSRILTEQECDAIFARVRAFAKGGGDTRVYIKSWWQGELRWSRNRVSLAADRRDVMIKVTRRLPDTARGDAITNQVDDVSLEGAVRAAERQAIALGLEQGMGTGFAPPLPKYAPPVLPIWSDATFNLTGDDQAKLVRAILDAAEAKGMLATGYLEVRGAAMMSIGTDMAARRTEKYAFWEKPYRAFTQAQCSVMVRNPEGTGSGWAGLSSYDLAKIDTAKLGAVALQKCLASQNPVALEPGRYTVILEPAAVATFVEPLMNSLNSRIAAETGNVVINPWVSSTMTGYSKLGEKVMDERISIWHDPADPRLGIIINGPEDPGPVTWVQRGVLTSLATEFNEAVGSQLKGHTARPTVGYIMGGGKASIEEMIAKTQRGLLVSRIGGLELIRMGTLLSTGFTRDGLWLIENGKITKAVKNFRFTESPLFMLNALDDLGEPVPVFRPTGIASFAQDDDVGTTPGSLDAAGPAPALVPPIKVRDFNFTALADAV